MQVVFGIHWQFQTFDAAIRFFGPTGTGWQNLPGQWGCPGASVATVSKKNSRPPFGDAMAAAIARSLFWAAGAGGAAGALAPKINLKKAMK